MARKLISQAQQGERFSLNRRKIPSNLDINTPANIHNRREKKQISRGFRRGVLLQQMNSPKIFLALFSVLFLQRAIISIVGVVVVCCCVFLSQKHFFATSSFIVLLFASVNVFLARFFLLSFSSYRSFALWPTLWLALFFMNYDVLCRDVWFCLILQNLFFHK